MVLNGRFVYSACCHSLSGLGQAFKATFSSNTPPPEFVGYQSAFNFHFANEKWFRDTINDSIFDYIVNQRPASTLCANQKAKWDQLKKDFSAGGSLSGNPDAWVAAANAQANAASIGFA